MQVGMEGWRDGGKEGGREGLTGESSMSLTSFSSLLSPKGIMIRYTSTPCTALSPPYSPHPPRPILGRFSSPQLIHRPLPPQPPEPHVPGHGRWLQSSQGHLAIWPRGHRESKETGPPSLPPFYRGVAPIFSSPFSHDLTLPLFAPLPPPSFLLPP